MKEYQVFKRTFDALKYPKNSVEREKLNLSGITSEYMTSYKFHVVSNDNAFSSSFRTKKDAYDFIDRLNNKEVKS